MRPISIESLRSWILGANVGTGYGLSVVICEERTRRLEFLFTDTNGGSVFLPYGMFGGGYTSGWAVWIGSIDDLVSAVLSEMPGVVAKPTFADQFLSKYEFRSAA